MTINVLKDLKENLKRNSLKLKVSADASGNIGKVVHELEKKSQELEGHSVEKGEVEEIAVDPHAETP